MAMTGILHCYAFLGCQFVLVDATMYFCDHHFLQEQMCFYVLPGLGSSGHELLHVCMPYQILNMTVKPEVGAETLGEGAMEPFYHTYAFLHCSMVQF